MNQELIMQWGPIVLMIGIFYFLILRPQARRRKEEKEFAETLKIGDKVIMSSGIHGKISQINAEKGTVQVETGAGKITFEKSAISTELSKKLIAPLKEK
ncbi:preprotein translocase subunit YajC [Nonlabens arenilitoris]|uniref:Sec translocon accessory complex subunit YajC n=1 Tax=Nonlabens arenilitoris TaxID=1217969 RepID=A0A2S7UB02_9FLAO|nr:preprotein translocase subunit YajC [Nonlabens arenilitoris]PQJ32059.1 preprotein translocase subunit YajC [Nonlabens arenilitoris]